MILQVGRLNCRQYFRVNVSNINLKGGGGEGSTTSMCIVSIHRSTDKHRIFTVHKLKPDNRTKCCKLCTSMVIKQIRVGSKMSNSRVKGWSCTDLGGVGGIHHPPPPHPPLENSNLRILRRKIIIFRPLLMKKPQISSWR